MRRTTIILSAALVLLALAPAAAVARHHRRHHHRSHHARIAHFGHDTTSSTNAGSSDNAGTVKAFNNGVLTIMLNDGSAVSGAVTRDTELECMAPDRTQTMHTEGDGGSGDQSGDGDNSGSGEDQGQSSDDQSSGEDQGDAAEQNDDQAEDQNENEAGNNCSTSNLTPGATVREAELRVSGTGSAWKKVELGS
jgi:hypothetical protein